jgi:hypothetical protein
MAPAKIVPTRGGWPFFEADVTAAKVNPPDVVTLVAAPPPPAAAAVWRIFWLSSISLRWRSSLSWGCDGLGPRCCTLTCSKRRDMSRSGPQLWQGDGLSDLRRLKGLTQFRSMLRSRSLQLAD